MSELAELIAKLESASDGSAELDEAIDRLVSPWPSDAQWIRASTCPHYTFSLDAALTLVPEGFHWLAGIAGSAAQATVWRETPIFSGYGSNPALALCIASLKAKAEA